MNFHFPNLRLLCMAENCTANMHNVYTPRGAQVRDALGWSKYIGEAIELFAADTDVCFASHHWPRWGSDGPASCRRTRSSRWAIRPSPGRGATSTSLAPWNCGPTAHRRLGKDGVEVGSWPRSASSRSSMRWPGATSFPDQVADGAIELDGDIEALIELFGCLDKFSTWFPIVTP